MYLLKETGEPPPNNNNNNKPNWISAGLNAGGCGFKPRPEQDSGSLNNWGESGDFCNLYTQANF